MSGTQVSLIFSPMGQVVVRQNCSMIVFDKYPDVLYNSPLIRDIIVKNSRGTVNPQK